MTLVQGSPTRAGPEAALVQEFVDAGLPETAEGERRTIFIEPQLGATRPDIVVLDSDPCVTTSWPEARMSLEATDLRLAQLLFVEGPLPEERIRFYYRRCPKAFLERLEAARLVDFVGGKWTLRPLPGIFSLRRIIAFEAKISALSKAIEQAHLNTWFASESYVLTTNGRRRDHIIQKAQERGIGLWPHPSELSSSPMVSATQRPVPQSFASWLFNEMAWKSSLGGI